MKQSEIKVGKTYRNKGAGRTTRTVVAIGPETSENEAMWFSINPRPNDLVVTFSQFGRRSLTHMFLRSFASWVGSAVES